MDTEFLKKLSDESAQPRPEFKERLERELAARSQLHTESETAADSTRSLSQLQQILLAAASIAAIATVSLFIASGTSSSVGYDQISPPPVTPVVVAEPSAAVRGASDEPLEATATDSLTTPSSQQEDNTPTLAEEPTATESDATEPATTAPDPTLTMVCRDNQKVEISQNNMLPTDYMPPCADESFLLQYWNASADSELFTTPRRPPDASAMSQAIKFAWGADRPMPEINEDMFIVHATRTMYFTDGNIRISGSANDSVRVFLDNELAVDYWIGSGDHIFDELVAVNAGLHDVRVEYFDVSGVAQLSIVIDD